MTDIEINAARLVALKTITRWRKTLSPTKRQNLEREYPRDHTIKVTRDYAEQMIGSGLYFAAYELLRQIELIRGKGLRNDDIPHNKIGFNTIADWERGLSKWEKRLEDIRRRAAGKKREFKISLYQWRSIPLPDACPILGIRLNYLDSSTKETTPSVDRIDNNRGYVSDNIQIISIKANTAKNVMSADELKKFAAYYSVFS